MPMRCGARRLDHRDGVELCDGVRRGFYRAVVHTPSLAIVRCAPPCPGGGTSSAFRPPSVHDGARDPGLPRGPRAHETVWGRALRNAIWGDHDPEWTAGDNAGDSTLRPHDSVTVPRGAPRLERPL